MDTWTAPYPRRPNDKDYTSYIAIVCTRLVLFKKGAGGRRNLRCRIIRIAKSSHYIEEQNTTIDSSENTRHLALAIKETCDDVHKQK